MKRKFAIAVAMVMALTMFSTVSFATENGDRDVSVQTLAVAECDGVEYTSLDDAINAADVGDTVKLLSDIKLANGESIEINSKSITLDLNEWGISAASSEDVLIILDSNVTIQDGKINNHSSACPPEDGHFLTALVADQESNVTLSNVTTDSWTGENDAELYYAGYESVINVINCDMTIHTDSLAISDIFRAGKNSKVDISKSSLFSDNGCCLYAVEGAKIYVRASHVESASLDPFAETAFIDEDSSMYFYNSEIYGTSKLHGIYNYNGYVYLDNDYVYGNPALLLGGTTPKAKIKRARLKAPGNYSAVRNYEFSTYGANISLASGTTVDKDHSKWRTKSYSYIAFNTRPDKTSISKLTRGKKQITVKWKKKASPVAGYQICLATNSNFTKNKKTVTVAGKSSYKKTVKDLKSGKTYYVKVRTYKKLKEKNGDSGTSRTNTYYSEWSPVKKIKTK